VRTAWKDFDGMSVGDEKGWVSVSVGTEKAYGGVCNSSPRFSISLESSFDGIVTIDGLDIGSQDSFDSIGW